MADFGLTKELLERNRGKNSKGNSFPDIFPDREKLDNSREFP